jgi:hypothetical protein
LGTFLQELCLPFDKKLQDNGISYFSYEECYTYLPKYPEEHSEQNGQSQYISRYGNLLTNQRIFQQQVGLKPEGITTMWS